MAATERMAPAAGKADREALLKILEEQDAARGRVHNPNASALLAREMMLADGVNPEDNIFSSEIIRMRYGNGE